MSRLSLAILAIAALAGAAYADDCLGCSHWTSGPCMHQNDGTCLGYYPGTTQCPAGTAACTGCQGCSHGTSGPCRHMAEGNDSCGPYMVPGTCWPGMERCATGEVTDEVADDDRRRMADATTASRGLLAHPESGLEVDPFTVSHTCGECWGETQGQCRHDNDGSCEPWDENHNCPAGTHYCYECEDCADGTSGPCRHATEGDNTCFPYVFGTTCPVGTYSCATFEAGGGVPGSEDGESEPDFQFIPPTTPQTCGGCLGGSGPCVHQNDFSCHDYMEGTTICPPGTEACTLCSGCNGGFGPCRHQNDGSCTDYLTGTTCPPGTSRCGTAEIGPAAVDHDRRLNHFDDLVFTCALCDEETGGVGPCIDDNNVCHHYADAASHTCPPNTHACVECQDCAYGAGPCRHATPGDDGCFAYSSGTTCPVGTFQCQTGEGAPPPDDGEVGGEPEEPEEPQSVCPACWGATSGECQHLNDLSCTDKVDGVCPSGTRACPLCSGCAHGTVGPCKHNVDGTCGGYMSGTTCWPGMTRCSTGEEVLETPDRRLVDGEVVEDPEYSCSGCTGDERGPCQHINDGTCLPFAEGTQSCPAGSRHCAWCRDCTGETQGPCRHLNDGTCMGYGAGTSCPAGTVQCETEEAGGVEEGGGISFPPNPEGASVCYACVGGTSGPCRHNNDGTCHDFADDNNNCPAGTTPCEACAFCVGGTSGPCRHLNDGTCTSFQSDGTCPAGTSRCSDAEGTLSIASIEGEFCGPCFGESSGPCRHGDSDVCHEYYTGTTICPAGTSECIPCNDCEGDTGGPCRHDNDGTCIGYEYGSVCPSGSVKCATGEQGGFPPKGPGDQCSGCWPGTQGPCQRSDTVCDPFFPGSQECPAGANECAEAGSLPSEPIVVVDIGLDGIGVDDIEEDGFGDELCEIIDNICEGDHVVLEFIGEEVVDRRARALSETRTRIGAVIVVPGGFAHSPEEVADALRAANDDGSLANAMGAESSTLSATAAAPTMRAPAAPAEEGLSTLAIGLIGAGAVCVVGLVAGGYVISKRSGQGAQKKVTPAGIDASTGAPQELN